jgi:outer membrane protein assembly factor BamB
MRVRIAAFVVGLVIPVVLNSQAPPSYDWPQWRGPARDGVSKETGLLQSWPQGGPAVAWKAEGLGNGYGSVSMKGNRVFVQGRRGRQTLVHALDRATGAYVWSKNLGTAAEPGDERGPGPRSTPTLDDDRLYVFTEGGLLVCLRAVDGTAVWQRDLMKDFSGRNITWLLSESPLIDGDKVIVSPGGRRAGMVALEKMTGKTIWTAADVSEEAGYSSVVPVEVGGIRAYTTFTSSAAIGVRASDGKLMWRYTRAANDVANITTPLVVGSQVFYTSNYGVGGALVNLTPNAGELRADEVYFTREMQNHHGGVVVVNGTLYGFNAAILTALDFASGRMLWRHRSVGKGAVTYADGRLYIVGEDRVVGLAEVTPAGYRETGSFEIADQGWPTWAHPVVSDGRLYIRNQATLTAYNVRAR